MPLDYSKWNHIEVSDDEDDTHPNIDTPSLFRWRHKARLERDAEFKKEKEELEAGYKKHLEALSKCRHQLEEAQKDSKDVTQIQSQLDKLLSDDQEWQAKNEAFKKKERLKPLNIDSICHEGKSFSAINHVSDSKKDQEDDAEDMVDRLKKFVQTHDKEIKHFGMLQRPQDTKEYLMKHPYLACEETANHLLLWCIDLMMEEKKSLMYHVSHQCVIMQYILELAKFKKCDPKAMIGIFFQQFLDPQPEYQAAFQAELDAFRERIEARAKVKVEEAVEKYEEEERQKRLGPGGLDPVEVMQSLPKELQECFEKRDVELLKQVLGAMPPAEGEMYLKKCIDSGLWVENANAGNEEEEEEEGAEPGYHEPKEEQEDPVPTEQFNKQLELD